MSAIRFQKVVLGVGAILFLIKFFAFWSTGSNAIFSDALESVINLAAGSFALYSLVVASRPKDLDHPYGHGKVEFISAGIEGGLIIIAGLGIIYKSVVDLIIPHELSALDLGLYLTAGAGSVNYLLGVFSEKKGNETHSPTMIASGKHLKSDGYSSLGLVVGLAVVILTEKLWIDSIIAIAFGLLIIYTGSKELRKAIAGIMDEADMDLLNRIIAHLDQNRRENWIDLHNMRAQKFGKQIHLDCHMTLPNYLTVKEGHDEVEEVERIVENQFKDGLEIFIHTDPCTPLSCRICSKQNCQIRSAVQEESITWNLDNVLTNERHK